MSEYGEGSGAVLRIVVTDTETSGPNWDGERMRLVIEAARKVIEVMRGPYRHSPGKLTVHQVDTLSGLASLLGEAPIYVDAAAILTEHDHAARLEVALGEIVDALDYDLSEVRMVDPAIEIPEREARLALALRNAHSLVRAGKTAPKA